MWGKFKNMFETSICNRDKWKVIELEIISAIPWSNAKINCTTNAPINLIRLILMLILKNNKLRKTKKIQPKLEFLFGLISLIVVFLKL